MKAKRPLVFAAAALVLLPLAFLVYVIGIEPGWLRVQVVPIPVSQSQGETLRIVHLTDLHWGRSSPRYLERVFREAAAQRPHAIVLTGDYMKRLIEPEDRSRFTELLKILAQAASTYAVPGNHDGGEWARRGGGYENTDMIRGLITAAGIRYLENEYTCPELQGARVCIGGIGDLWAGDFKPEAFLPAFEAETADLKILLLHNPDGKEFIKNAAWDLLLAGHTHGGQVVMPLIGAPWAPTLDKSILKGLMRYQDHWVHISPGVGMSGAHVRFNARPEVSVLEVGI